MNPIDENRAQIEELCRRYGVRRLDAFGSVLRDDFDATRSDVDFVLEFEPDSNRNRFHDYFDLRDALSKLLGRRVDLVMDGAVRNRFIRAAIERSRQPVYGT